MPTFIRHDDLHATVSTCVTEVADAMRAAIDRGDMSGVRALARDLVVAGESIEVMASGERP